MAANACLLKLKTVLIYEILEHSGMRERESGWEGATGLGLESKGRSGKGDEKI